jgi:predicted nucleic acid-binding protein
MYVLDTNVLIYYSKNESDVIAAVEDIYKENKLIYISAITEAEFFSYANLVNEEVERIEAFLETIAIVSFESRLARLSGLIRRTYNLELADSAIAATALLPAVRWSHAMSLILKELMGCVYVQFNLATTRLYDRRKHLLEDSPTFKVAY